MAEDKKKMKARIIQKYLPSCCGYKCYTQGLIPMSKFCNAHESYAGMVSYSDTLGMIDDSPSGDGSTGFLFTDYGFYMNGVDHCVYYSSHPQYGSIPGYNMTIFNKMLDELYQADGISGREIAEGAFKLASAFLDAWLDG